MCSAAGLTLKHIYLGQTLDILFKVILGKTKLTTKINNSILFIIGQEILNNFAIISYLIKILKQNDLLSMLLALVINPINIMLSLF